jgi:hypothetical protein
MWRSLIVPMKPIVGEGLVPSRSEDVNVGVGHAGGHKTLPYKNIPKWSTILLPAACCLLPAACCLR